MEYNNEFWEALQTLVEDSEIIIDRPKGTVHPKYPRLIYYYNYGYLKYTSAIDGGGVDIWLGSLNKKIVTGLIVTVDLLKKDCEVKILFDCSEGEQKNIFLFHNQTEKMKGILVQRESW